MVLAIPNGFAQVAFVYALEGDSEEMVSTVGVDFSTMSGSDQDNLDDITDAWGAGWGAGFAGWSFLGSRARVGVSGGTVTVESPRAIVGTAPGNTLPQNCCVLVRKGTALAGRHGRGRMYLPPFALPEGEVGKNGVITTLGLNSLQGSSDLAMPVATYPYVLLHSVASGIAPTPIVSFVVDRVIATQRRRLR